MQTKITNKSLVSTLLLLLFLISFFFHFDTAGRLKYYFMSKDNLILILSPVNKNINTLSCENYNRFYFEINVKDSNGEFVKHAPIKLSSTNKIGSFSDTLIKTNELGFAIVYYQPPESITFGKDTVKIETEIENTGISDSIELKLKPVPSILIHGYQENELAFENMNAYLRENQLASFTFKYDWAKGVRSARDELESFLTEKNHQLLSEGFQTNSFALISHSLGGIISRYYTCDYSYVNFSNVSKLIFISVPHNGSDIARLGDDFFKDDSIKDLAPNGKLLKKDFPLFINSGLNHKIETGNILAQYDEVVTQESASLDFWNIKTRIFNVGDNNLTVNNLIKGNIIKSPNHNSILNNKRIFEEVKNMLFNKLPYPITVKSDK